MIKAFLLGCFYGAVGVVTMAIAPVVWICFCVEYVGSTWGLLAGISGAIVWMCGVCAALVHALEKYDLLPSCDFPAPPPPPPPPEFKYDITW